jgi:hypothetical protein
MHVIYFGEFCDSAQVIPESTEIKIPVSVPIFKDEPFSVIPLIFKLPFKGVFT